ncbi:STAS/SEC14 domain-containing protein [Sediminitomix flava]|uniref:SpoIIAA-like protein n=1 Tax=Sediminitomix flava TaxID=379075 RepID=A0A315ZC39_SEDFL|nr:STAS/SEC14 domain-containing protein [Sediminitomix flava]PWJ43146.1 SpoIIAA-like protein [Sediminitomix flava]
MEILNNLYCNIYTEPEKELLHVEWKEDSYLMSFEEVKEVVNNMVEVYANDEQINLLYSDNRKLGFTFADQFQMWYETNIAPVASKHLKKMAMIVSSDMFSQLSIEQIIEEEQGSLLNTQHFDNKEDAINWLLN